MRFGAGIWLFGQFVDRYATDAYGPEVSTLEAIERAGAVGRHRGARHQLSLLRPRHHGRRGPQGARRGGHQRVVHHARTSTRASSRAARSPTRTPPCGAARWRSASRASTSARQLGAPTVKLWPGQDGFDYPFQADYRELWRLELDGVRAVADMDPGIRVAIEYKTKEPRTHISLATAARTLVGIHQIDRDDVGIVVDLGHSHLRQGDARRRPLARPRARPAVHDRGQRQLARVGRRSGRRVRPPDRDARVLPRDPPASAGTSRSCSTSSRSARTRSRRRGPASGRCGRSTPRSTASISTRCRRRAGARTRSRRSASSSTCSSAACRALSRSA